MKRIVLSKNPSSTISVTCFQNFRYECTSEVPKNLLKKRKGKFATQEFGEGWENDEDLS
ncbi:unnamed protein product [Acanthoscelides obtectus]|uniref:Uncharacterized protein n=1 Tax=Acanthoscelides obtectus TaxID=200917 RepID=A0A9P0PQT1_ACAOB|nr:unnamed protein product [Acanthoscelides obtectus]CAK1656834.1 hypothetical protein AOBTE_LOCUS19945 [Acanthoscelides obtectus]